MELSMGPEGKIPNFLKHIMGMGDDEEYDVIGPLDKNEAELFNEAVLLQDQLQKIQAKTENTYRLFWATVRNNRDLHDAGKLRMNEKTGMIEMGKEDPIS